MSAEPMTVGRLQHALLDLPPAFDYHPTRDAVVQFTTDGERFWTIDSLDEWGDGGIVAQLVPFPPVSDRCRRTEPDGTSTTPH